MTHSPVKHVSSGLTALVAEDHEIFRTALARILRDDCGFASVVEAGTHDDAFRFLEDRPNIDLAAFDLGMPGMHGLIEIKTIRRLYPDLRVTIVTASERRQDMLDAVAAGVHGYIPKTLARTRMAAAFNAVLQDQVFLPWSITDVSAIERAAAAEADHPQNHPSLTVRQMEVLRLIRAGKSNKEIARDLNLTESTVKVHTNALYRALGVRNRVSAASASLF
jgi:DNA-binding NarL/FixJ family response regulator